MIAASLSSSEGVSLGRHARHTSTASRATATSNRYRRPPKVLGGGAIRGFRGDYGPSRRYRRLREDRLFVLELVEAGDDVTPRHRRAANARAARPRPHPV